MKTVIGKKLEKAISVYQVFPDPAVVIKAEYSMWRSMWQQQPTVDRPRTALEALDHVPKHLYPSSDTADTAHHDGTG